MSFPKNRRRCQLTLSALLLSGAVLSGCASGEGTASGKDGVAAVPETPVALSSLGFDTARLNASKTPLFLSGRMDAAVVDGASAAQVLLARLAPSYRLSAETSFQVLSEQTDENGLHYIRLGQLHAGIPVVDGEVVFQSERSGAVLAVIGELSPDLRVEVPAAAKSPTAGTQAIRRALASVAKDGTLHFHGTSSLALVAPDTQPTDPVRLTHRALVEYVGDEGMELAEVFVSVATGEVVSQRTHIHRALDRTLYTLGGNCIGTAMGMLPGTKVRKEGDPTSTDTDANNVYDQQSSTYYFYKHLFNRDSYDDKGAGMIATVNVQFPAGFSCSPNNAAWLGSPYFQMAYGKGDGMVLLNLTLGLDVTAHEITHAVTSTTSNLTYQNESGALNEGMSDIMGSGVEAWVASGGTAMGNPAMFKHSADTWLLGKEVAGPKLPGGSLRFMDNPTKDGQSKDWYAERIMPGGTDRGGVHLNSGMPNLVHVLMTQGGTHPRGKSTVQVPAIGIESSLRIFYLTNSKLLTASSTFEQARYAMAQAAQTLYGRCTKEVSAVQKAWDAVGVPGVWQPCVRPPSHF
ncbi:MAG TPA: M4 family metallopeptidase [Pseudomonadota bacterium]|nr:M4 family metallopeptidase [Pseudomonadota bacterium]